MKLYQRYLLEHEMKGDGAHGKDIKKGTRLRCAVCGREVTIDKKGKGPLICCMEPMHVMGE
jgi:desulfoferrodoxin-like iron-binding protein